MSLVAVDGAVEQVGWPGPAEGLAGSVVDLVGDADEVVDRDGAEVGAFGEVVPQEAVGVLVGAALPWGVGVAEVDVRAERPR